MEGKGGEEKVEEECMVVIVLVVEVMNGDVKSHDVDGERIREAVCRGGHDGGGGGGESDDYKKGSSSRGVQKRDQRGKEKVEKEIIVMVACGVGGDGLVVVVEMV